MTIITIKYLGSISIFFISLLPGWLIFRKPHQHYQKNALHQALARGLFFGLALFELIPAMIAIDPTAHWPMIACAMSFTLLLWMEHLGPQKGLAMISCLTLAIHSFFMGSAMGFSLTMNATLFLFLAIILHKFQESFALAQLLADKKINRPWVWFIGFTLTTPLGILMATFIGLPSDSHSLIAESTLGCSAGTLLYLGTLHGYLPNGNEKPQCCNQTAFLGFILGVLSVSALLLLHPH